MRLQTKHILLGITGSIAAYKVPELIRFLQKEGATVQVMVTPSALQFVTVVTLEALSGFPVLTDLFQQGEKAMAHIHASRKADLILIAPTTAHMLAKLAAGMADDIVSSTVLASKVPVLIAPAMNVEMWKNPLVTRNVNILKKVYRVIGPADGYLACGEYGEGRLVELNVLIDEVIKVFTPQNLKGKKVLITAGATREYLDPVRFLSNASSGKMGFALVREAYLRGGEVMVILGHVEKSFSALPVKQIQTTGAEDMAKAVMKHISEVDIFVSAAAVSDYRFEERFRSKLKKSSPRSVLKILPTPDILGKVLALKKKPFVVGFALETDHVLQEARQKFQKKKVDLLVVNTQEALGADQAKVSFIDSKKVQSYGFLSKEDISRNIFDILVKSF